MYTTVINHGCSYSYENHFWIKDVTFGVTVTNKMYAELTNCEHKLHVDNPQMMTLLMELKTKHQDDELTAEIDMNDEDLMKLIDGCEDVKKSKRHSIVTFPSSRVV